MWERVASYCAALGHPDRMRIVFELLDGPPLSSSALAERLEIPAATLSRHMHLLASAGVVARTSGRRSPWALGDADPVRALLLAAHELAVANARSEADQAVEGAQRLRRKRRSRELSVQ